MRVDAKCTNLIYAMYDDVAENVLQYYIVPEAVWAERTFKTLCNQITCGEPSEFSFRLVGCLDDIDFMGIDMLTNHCKSNDITMPPLVLRGGDYVGE